MIFLDTSAIYALADTKDKNYAKAKRLFARALSEGEEFVLHNYILAEAGALMQRRLGLEQAKKFFREAGQFHILWVERSLHKRAEEYFHEHATRKLSFVDCASFVVMNEQRIQKAFAFDSDFEKAGFRCL